MRVRCSAIHKIIGLPRSKNDRLTQTAKSHLIEQAKQELFGVAAFDGAKYTEKGNALEPFAIQGSGMIRGRQQLHQRRVRHTRPEAPSDYRHQMQLGD